MTKGKKDGTDGRNRSNFCSHVIISGILIAVMVAVAGIYWLFPQFLKNHLPLLLIAVGLVIPPLFGLQKFWVGYGWQVGIAPGLAFVLMGIFVWLFGYRGNVLWEDTTCDLILTNLIVLTVWLILVFVAFRGRLGKGTVQQQKKRDSESGQKGAQQGYRNGEIWRDYRWIIAPAVIILLFLFDTSWAQSILSTSSLKKSVFHSASWGTLNVHAEYPSQILFDETSPSEIHLWTTGSIHCANLEISADGLLFAIKPLADTPLKWYEKLTLKFNKTTTATTLLVQPSTPPETASKSVRLTLTFGSRNVEDDWEIIIESKQDSQIRGWKKNFLDTGSTVVSLISAVFAGIKQLDEEKKRQRAERMKQALANFDTDAQNDLSKTLQEYWDLTADWNEWDQALQDQFRRVYSSFIEQKLWDTLAYKTIPEITNAIDLCLRICKRIFAGKEETPNSVLLTLQSALRLDKNSPRALLSILKKHPASINTAKIIARAFHHDLKENTIKLANEFTEQVGALRTELGMLETEQFPLQAQFTYYIKPHPSEDRLTAWLRAHELECSPFADAENPFHSVFEAQVLIEWASPAFTLPVPSLQHTSLEFANSWDAGAALFEFCIKQRSNVRLKDSVFFVLLTPGMVADYGDDHPQKLLLHALAEQWIWSLAEAKTLFYSMNSAERDLVARLLRWHALYASIAVHKISEIAHHFQKEDEKEILGTSLENIKRWLSSASADDLRKEEINALIGLRPAPKQDTMFLISAVDLNPYATWQMPFSLHRALREEADWLSTHNGRLISFQLGGEGQQTVSHTALVNQCNIRVQKCSKEKNLVFNQLFDAPGREPDAILAQKANGSPGRMVRLGQKLLLQHVKKHPLNELLHIEDLETLE